MELNWHTLSEETIIELHRAMREAEENVRRRLAEQQKGELFYDES